jgi:hypothetical protein
VAVGGEYGTDAVRGLDQRWNGDSEHDSGRRSLFPGFPGGGLPRLGVVFIDVAAGAAIYSTGRWTGPISASRSYDG